MTTAPEPKDKLDTDDGQHVGDWRGGRRRERTGGRAPGLGRRSTGGTVEDDVRRLRQRIFTASQAGDLKKVRNLQKLMLRSRANALVSVRRVTRASTLAARRRASTGRSLLTSAGKAELADWVQHRPRPWTAQPGQAGVHPEGEREAAPARDSRDRRPGAAGPGRQRAGTRVGGAVRAEVLWVPAGPWLPRRDRGDLRDAARAEPVQAACGCSTRTWRRRSTASTTTTCSPSSARSPRRELIAAWLKAGVIEHGRFTPTEEGTPQGGVISPLLLNVALHGMEAGRRSPLPHDRHHMPGRR